MAKRSNRMARTKSRITPKPGSRGRAKPGDSRPVYAVFGKVTLSNGAPAIGFIVIAYDKDESSLDTLGQAITDANGAYKISYADANFRGSKKERGGADVVVCVYDQRNEVLFTSKKQNNAPARYQLNVQLPARQFVVRGVVKDTDDNPLANMLVRGFDRDLRREEPLGLTTTDAEGRYQISYSSAEFTRAEKDRADLVVRVMAADGKTELAKSDTLFNAPASADVNLTVSLDKLHLDSEWERYHRELAPLLENIQPQDLTDEDLQFLHGETGIVLSHLEFVRLDARWRVAHLKYQVPPAVYYGLLRQGVSTTFSALLSVGSSRWRTLLKQALADRHIPSELGTRFEEVIQILTALAVEQAFVPGMEADAEAPTVGVLLASTGVPPDQQRVIAKTLLAMDGDLDQSSWTKMLLDAGVSNPAVDQTRFAIQAHAFFDRHVPTLAQSQQTFAKTFSSITDLAQVSRTQWLSAAQALERQRQLPKAFSDGVAYGTALADRVEALFPTKVLAHQLTGSSQTVRQAVGKFLLANPSFDILQTPVHSFVATANLDGFTITKETLKQELGKTVRAARLTVPGNRTGQIKTLLDRGFDSALKVVTKGRVAFMREMVDAVSSTQAAMIYAQADLRMGDTSLMTLWMRDYLDLLHPVFPQAQVEPNSELARWAAMFGNENGCVCRPCDSVHGPAAYLVDLFEFLKDKAARDGGPSLLDLLFARRPDLQHLKLNCANADTPLPYIDLVIELLERQIAGVWSAESTRQTPDTVPNTKDVATRLRAMPMEEGDRSISSIYETGDFARAVFPWNLPFDPVHAQANVYFDALGIAPMDVINLVEGPRESALRIGLRLSAKQWSLLHLVQNNSAPDVAAAWGLSSLSTTADSLRLDKFTGDKGVLHARSGVSLDDLFMLIESPLFVGWAINIDRQPTAQSDPCNIDDAQIRHGFGNTGRDLSLETQVEVYDLMQRVLRLRTALDWPLRKLVLALQTLGVGRDHRQFDLISLSRLVSLSHQLGVSVEHLSSLLLVLGQDAGDVSVREHAQRAWLAMLQLSAQDHTDLLALGLPDTLALSGELPASAEDPEPRRHGAARRLELLEEVVADLERLRTARVDFAELRYVLLGQDLTPPVFEPTADNSTQQLASLKTAITAAAERLAPLPADADSSAREAHQKLWLRLRSAAIEERLREITGFAAVAFVVPGLQIVPEGFTPEPALLNELNALDLFEHFARTPSGAGLSEATTNALNTLRKISSVCRLLQRLQFNEADTRALARIQASGSSWLNFNRLPLREDGSPLSLIRPLLQACVAQTGMPNAETRVLSLAGMATGEEALNALEAGIDWGGALAVSAAGRTVNFPDGRASFQLLIETLRLPTDIWWKRPASYLMLQQAVRWLQQRRMKLSPSSDGRPVRNDLRMLLDATQIYLPDAERGTDIRSAVQSLETLARSQFASETAWYKAVTPAMDRLRIRHRDALLGYILHHNNHDWKTADQVNAHLLIDVQMGPCQLTSRIVQAHSAVQLYVQRCLLHLEKPEEVALGEVSDIAEWRQWEWMKNYRVWEAARKVFLYPENWAEPDVRDIKSPFFEELENKLLQDEVTTATVEHALQGYLQQLHDVARLDIRAMYEETLSELDGEIKAIGHKGNYRKVIHVVGRTHAVPHSYYYRKRLDDLSWTPWEKLELNIASDHLLLAAHKQRVTLFWATFKEVQTGLTAGATEQPMKASVTLHWSTKTFGKWSAPAQSELPDPIDLDDRDGWTFSVLRIVEEGILLKDYLPVLDEQVRGFWNVLHVLHGRQSRTTAYRIDPCTGSLSVVSNDPGFQLFGDNIFPPPNVYAKNNRYVENPESGGSQLVLEIAGSPALGATINDYALVFGSPSLCFFAHDRRQYLVRKVISDIPQIEGGTELQEVLTIFGERLTSSSPRIRWETQSSFRFEPHYHPYVCAMLERLRIDGPGGLYRSGEPRGYDPEYSGLIPTKFPRQRIHEPEETFARLYDPPTTILNSYPFEQFEFGFDTAYSLYNWEVFFHLPLLLADRLSKDGKYQEAQQWYHCVFDPTDVSFHETPEKFWRARPLFEEAGRWRDTAESLDTMMRRLARGAGSDISAQINAWRNDPFNPHLLARIRLVSYMKTVVQKYIENLLVWADSLFRRDTIESINEATQLYVLASEILGEGPAALPPMTRDSRSYDELRLGNAIDEFANAIEDILPSTEGGSLATDRSAPGLSALYFCIPSNPRLRELRESIDDRLFKIRHCMDINGRVRQLALFAPPIDPALLVRARAAGLDIGTALSMALDVRSSQYRFQSLLQKALEFTNEVRSFGGALLSALEKRDAEQMAQLRARHEVGLLKLGTEIKKQQIAEAETQLEAARRSRAQAETRLAFYTSREFMNREEQNQISNMRTAHVLETYGQEFNLLASIMHIIPDTQIGVAGGPTFGGRNLGDALSAFGSTFGFIASQFSFQANMSSIMAGHERRQDEWDFQAELARKELVQIDQQIVAAEIRLAIAEREQRNHEQQIAQAEEAEHLLRDKFTNLQLYNWLSGQLSAMHYQAYRMAFDLARLAEAAFHREADTPDDIIKLDHWDPGRKGLLAGDRLAQDLRRLEVAYMQANTRRFELTTHVSLRRLNAPALLALRVDGRCVFEIPKEVFDLDFPGHEKRRIKSVSISVPGVVGPYVGVHGVLKLLRPTDFIVSSTTIATSSGQNDAGVFQLDFRDERYLPFEGGELDGGTMWEFALPGTRTFDYNTISDLILHIQYTAKEGTASNGGSLISSEAVHPGTRYQLLDIRHDFPESWRRLREGSLSERVALREELFPYFVKLDEIRDTKLRRAGDVIDTIADDSFTISKDDLDSPWKGFLVVEYQLQ